MLIFYFLNSRPDNLIICVLNQGRKEARLPEWTNFKLFLRCRLLIPMFQRTEMSFDSTHFLDQLADLRNNRDDADVILDCQGELVKAHSFILATRFDCTLSKQDMLHEFHEKETNLPASQIFFPGLRTSRHS